MKRLNTAILIWAVLSAFVWAFDIPKPSAEVKRFQVDAISLRDITFLFEVGVKNPYPVNLSFDGLRLNFSVEGTSVFKATNQGGFTVPARGEKANTFTVTLPYEGIIALVKDYTSKEWLNTVIDGVLIIPLPKMPGLPQDISFNYKFEKKIPAIKPHVAITGFTVTPPSTEEVRKALIKAGSRVPPDRALGVFKDLVNGKKNATPPMDPTELDVPLRVSFTLEIKNDAKAKLSFTNLHYDLFVNDDSLIVGESSQVVHQADRTLVTITNEFSSKKLSKKVKTLFSERKGTFSVQGKASIKLPDEIRKESLPLNFTEGGTFTIK